MLEQFMKSVMAHLVSIEPMNAYVQKMPQGVKYPCYLLNKVDVDTRVINSFYFINTVTLYVRMFGKNEIQLKNKGFKVIQHIFANHRKIPILEEDGTQMGGDEEGRYMRVENIDFIEIPVDEDGIFCVELNFSFDTTNQIAEEEWGYLEGVFGSFSDINEEE